MEYIREYVMRGNTLPLAIIASAIIAFIAVISSHFMNDPSAQADMYVEPSTATHVVGDIFTIDVMVYAVVPVNVFAGELVFDSNVLTIDAIDYNTSIADLWAERPWYENGDGTLNFGGGTTQPGGFLGTGQLIRVTFKAKAPGTGAITLRDARILQHNGLGTDATLSPTIDAIVTVGQTEVLPLGNNAKMSPVTITSEPPVTDLNNDGKHTVGDVSVFMLYLATKDTRGDINKDGSVDTNDLSLVLKAQ